ncbi:MAG: hypothetical protein AAF686_06035 [Pseudomonadota bacterium]
MDTSFGADLVKRDLGQAPPRPERAVFRPRLATFCLIGLLCSACSQTGPLALQEPTFFFLTYNEGEINGQYNELGFSDADIEKIADWMCGDGRIDRVSEEKQATGLTKVTGQCLFTSISGHGRADFRKRESTDRIDARYEGVTRAGRLLRQERL